MFQRLFKNLFKLFEKKNFYKHKYVEEVPDSLISGTIYIISNASCSWQVVMLCPCPCKKVLHMSLMDNHHPFWRIEIDKRNKLSLYPSVNRTVGCKSHFFIKRSKIVWA